MSVVVAPEAGAMVFLAVSGTLSGRTLSVWKKFADEKQLLRGVVEQWAHTHEVLQRWQSELPGDVRATAGLGGPNLNLDSQLKMLRHLLPITSSGLAVTIVWPVELEQIHGNGASKNAESRSRLGRLRISTRYANVRRENAGFHESSTKQAKQDAGKYQETDGRFSQSAYIKAMRTPSCPSAISSSRGPQADEMDKEQLISRTLAVVGRKVGTSGSVESVELFQVVIKGPTPLVLNWEATCESFERKDGTVKSIPFPVFIPTYGRAYKAHLNWNAEHVFGHFSQGREGKLHPVVCIVVEPKQEDEYRAAWPRALMLVLPVNGRGPGFARWAIQKTCTKALLRPPQSKHDRIVGSNDMASWPVRRLSWIWIADDGLSMFYRLISRGSATSANARVQRLTNREAPDGRPMFHEAFLTVQRHALLPKMAVAGFLRDDGTAVCKRLEWKSDELALYKIVLLNLAMLRKLGVEYNPDLQMYEDICLNNEVLRRGGHTLKCQKFCYRASHVKAGGCFVQRTSRLGTHLEDLIAPSALKKLPVESQQAVRDLLRWVQSQERKFGFDAEEQQNAAAARKRKRDA